jgi:hypothetical protein
VEFCLRKGTMSLELVVSPELSSFIIQCYTVNLIFRHVVDWLNLFKRIFSNFLSRLR